MARRAILQYPDPRLRHRARPVEDFGDDLRRLVGDLTETLHATPGIGLSSIQVGDDRAVFVTDLSQDRTGVEVYCNPEMISGAHPGRVDESCLSIPRVEGTVIRSTEIEVRAVDLEGHPFERCLTGMEAVCFQHELDHLGGILFIDRLSFFHRLRVRAALWRRKAPATPP